MFYLCTEIITFPLKGRLSSFIVSGKFPYRVKFYTKYGLLSAYRRMVRPIPESRDASEPRKKGEEPIIVKTGP